MEEQPQKSRGTSIFTAVFREAVRVARDEANKKNSKPLTLLGMHSQGTKTNIQNIGA